MKKWLEILALYHSDTCVNLSGACYCLNSVSETVETYDEKTNWEVYKTQFSLILEANDWTEGVKACQLAASLRGEAAEVLQTLPDTERLHLNYLYNALDLRFGQKYSKKYAPLQMKTRLQKTAESLQEYASEVERLANLAFSDHPATVREVISLRYFVDGRKDGEIQKAVRMADIQDLKSVLLYALKLEATNEASCRDSHSVRGARGTADAPCESPWRKEIEKLREEIQALMAQEDPCLTSVTESKKVCSNRKGSIDENKDVSSKRPCSESSKNLSDSLRIGKKFDVIDPIFRQNSKSSDEKPSWQDIAPFHPTTKRYWALWDSLHLRNGVLYRKWESDDGKTFRWQLILPKTRVSTVLKELYGSPTGGHFGVMKTLQKVRERFYWNNVRSDMEKCCRRCNPWAACKGSRKRTRGKLQLYNVGAPFERIAFDILGPLQRSSNGNNNILVVMDYFTKWLKWQQQHPGCHGLLH
ncbi:retrovirus-related Pol polyprotein from transposon 412 [Trichonephila clavipes]|nr:retrovirus-related Pol polyprotein from transposon 412 [Trichonephila clavipes]